VKKIVCVTNVGLDEPGGRAAALKTRFETLEKDGWIVDQLILKNHHNVFLKTFELKRKIINGFKLVWSMNNPFTLHLPPLILKKAGYDFKWIAEFRDPIYLNPDPKKFRMVYRIVEKEIVSESDAVVIVLGMQVDKIDFLKIYNRELNGKIFVLPFAGLEDICSDPSPCKKTMPFTITYAGSFYKDWIEPLSFLVGFNKFVGKLNLKDEDVQVRFIGDWDEEYSKKVKKLNLQGYIKIKRWMNKKDIIPLFMNSHLFLYIGGSKTENKKNVSLKIWDYLCYARPIFALCKEDYVVKDFILKNRFGYVADYDDPKDISEKLIQAFLDFKTEKVHKSIKKLLQNRRRFDRKRHDDVFVQICDIIYSKHRSKII
jgi:glycosyltransferase involved in cell wall biosynthesis